MPFESHTLSAVNPKDCPYYRRMVNSRRGLLRQAIRLGWTKVEFKRRVKKLYIDRDWVITEMMVAHLKATRRKSVGKADPWQLFRHFKDEYIASGEEYPRPKRKRRKSIDKGRVREQRVRYKERQRVSELEKYARGRGRE